MSELPCGWTAQSLESIASHVTSGGTPTSGSSRYYVEHGGLPFAKTEDLSAARTKYIEHCELSITDSALKETAAKRYPSGTLLLSMYGTIGLTKIAAIEMAANQALCAMLPPFSCDVGYLYQHLEHYRTDWLKYSGHTTQANINGTTVRAHEVPLPPLVEQSKIAEVLDTLDTAIAQTEAIIAKLKAVKHGLLHDLQTRGIDANGELRAPQSEAPQLYKQSALGWIPKDWDVRIFGDLIDHVIDFRGRTPKKLGMDWGGGDILALSANNVQPGGIDTLREAYFGSEELYRKWMTSGPVSKGDVLLTMEAPLGNVAQIPDDAKYILSQRVVALRFDRKIALNDFAFWQMQSREFQKAMIGKSTGSTATGIQRAELIKLHFRTLPTPEQGMIAERMFAVEHRLNIELKALEKCQQEKIGLMDDLLTGNVRVTALVG